MNNFSKAWKKTFQGLEQKRADVSKVWKTSASFFQPLEA